MSLNIAPIGSCRIVDPLRRARKRFGFEVKRARSFGFSHTSPEAVQQLGFMRGTVDIPKDLWPLVSINDRETVLSETDVESDLYVIELCSEKILKVDDTYLQLNYLSKTHAAFFADTQRKNGYWKSISRGTDAEVDAYLAEHWSETEEQRKDIEILRRIRMSRADEDRTRADIRFLRDTLPNVMFVTHVNALTPAGDRILTRDRYLQMARRIAEEEGCFVYDPTDAMNRFGQDETIEKDLDHYTDFFKDRIVEDWFDQHISDLLGKIAVASDEITATRLVAPYVQARLGHGTDAQVKTARAWLSNLASEHPTFAQIEEALATAADHQTARG